MYICNECKKEFIPKNHGKYPPKYCSYECTQEHRRKYLTKEIEDGEQVGPRRLRNFLMKKQNERCSVCGWGEKNPTSNTVCLDLHHKDGNAKNSVLSNVELLCPNCHSLTDTYKRVGSKERRSTRIR
jgi:hypothetical protein